jgi:ABC-type Mn2+/Zn2+ transport system ATPase subunit
MTAFPTTSRASGAELMDSASPDPRMLAAEFRLLRRLNRWTGAAAAVERAVDSVMRAVPGDAVCVADFGSGAGDIGRAFLRTAARRGWDAEWLAADRSEDVLAIAAADGAAAGLRFARVDVLSAAATLGERTYDVAHASLMLHHLHDADVVRALYQMGRVARRAVVWNDLIRDGAGVAGARVMSLAGPATVRHDAVLSVRRGFTLDEAESFAEAAGLRVRSVRRWRHGPRFVVIAEPATAPMPARRPVMRADGVGAGFAARRVLADASLVVHAGEVRVLLGANGAGKTTLLRTLVGALRPMAGRAWCDRAFGPVGYLPQSGGLVAGIDARSNVEFVLESCAIARAGRGPAVDAALAAFGARDLADTRVDRMSVGQARRVALAAAFAADPTAIVLDEPEAGLDAEGRAMLMAAIVAAAQRGAGVLVATHEPDALRAACERTGVPFGGHRLEAMR